MILQKEIRGRRYTHKSKWGTQYIIIGKTPYFYSSRRSRWEPSSIRLKDLIPIQNTHSIKERLLNAF